MSSEITLSSSVQSAVESLFECAATGKELAQDSDSRTIFGDGTQIIVNHGTPVAIDEFHKALADKFGAAADVKVEWKEIVEDGVAGIVTGFAVITRSMKFRIRAGPAQMHTYATLSLKFDSDSDASNRTVSQMFFTSIDKAAPIHLQPAA